jgi:hypothetical protein
MNRLSRCRRIRRAHICRAWWDPSKMYTMRNQYKCHQHDRQSECPPCEVGVIFRRWLINRFSPARHRHPAWPQEIFAAKTGRFVTRVRLICIPKPERIAETSVPHHNINFVGNVVEIDGVYRCLTSFAGRIRFALFTCHPCLVGLGTFGCSSRLRWVAPLERRSEG